MSIKICYENQKTSNISSSQIINSFQLDSIECSDVMKVFSIAKQHYLQLKWLLVSSSSSSTADYIKIREKKLSQCITIIIFGPDIIHFLVASLTHHHLSSSWLCKEQHSLSAFSFHSFWRQKQKTIFIWFFLNFVWNNLKFHRIIIMIIIIDNHH